MVIRCGCGVYCSPRLLSHSMKVSDVLAQQVFVVEAEFFQAGPGHVDQFQCHLFGGSSGFAAFGDALEFAAGCLDHLIMSTAATKDLLGIREAEGF